MVDNDTRDRVALILRRAGFGASPQDLERYVGLGVDGTLDELLHPERVQEDFDGLLDSLTGHLIDLQNIEDVQTWWLYRMVPDAAPVAGKDDAVLARPLLRRREQQGRQSAGHAHNHLATPCASTGSVASAICSRTSRRIRPC